MTSPPLFHGYFSVARPTPCGSFLQSFLFDNGSESSLVSISVCAFSPLFPVTPPSLCRVFAQQSSVNLINVGRDPFGHDEWSFFLSWHYGISPTDGRPFFRSVLAFPFLFPCYSLFSVCRRLVPVDNDRWDF